MGVRAGSSATPPVIMDVGPHRCCLYEGELIPELVASIVERIDSGYAPMRIFIKLIAPQFHFKPAKLQE